MKLPPDRGSVKKKLKPAVLLGSLVVWSQLLLLPPSQSPSAPRLVSTWHPVLGPNPAGESELPPRSPVLPRALPRPRPRPPLPNNPRKRSRFAGLDTCLLTCVRVPTLPRKPPRTVPHRVLQRNPPPGHKHLRPLKNRRLRPRNGRPGGDSSSKSWELCSVKKFLTDLLHPPPQTFLLVWHVFFIIYWHSFFFFFFIHFLFLSSLTSSLENPGISSNSPGFLFFNVS